MRRRRRGKRKVFVQCERAKRCESRRKQWLKAQEVDSEDGKSLRTNCTFGGCRSRRCFNGDSGCVQPAVPNRLRGQQKYPFIYIDSIQPTTRVHEGDPNCGKRN